MEILELYLVGKESLPGALSEWKGLGPKQQWGPSRPNGNMHPLSGK